MKVERKGDNMKTINEEENINFKKKIEKKYTGGGGEWKRKQKKEKDKDRKVGKMR